MLYDILIPSRFETFYLQKKRVLSFEITPLMVQAILIEYSAKSISLINKQQIILKDLSPQAQTNAIKKIASNIGSYDELVTVFSSAAVVYKELTLPFVGRDALQMVVPFEVESLLPFAIEDAVIDFLITQQDLQAQQSTVLIAAIRKEDLDAHRSLFEKADLSISVVTVDIFALYELYKSDVATTLAQITPEPKKFFFDYKKFIATSWFSKLYQKFARKKEIVSYAPILQKQLEIQPKQAELLVDIGFDVVRILYLQDTVLTAIRVIPAGASDIAQRVSQNNQAAYYDVMHDIVTMNAATNFQEPLRKELVALYEEISKTLLFFQKQHEKIYRKPQKIWFAGFLTNMSYFKEDIQNSLGIVADVVDIASVQKRLKLIIKNQEGMVSVLNLAIGLFVHAQPSVNFLKSLVQKNDDMLFIKQIIAVVVLTVMLLGGVFWRSSVILQTKEQSYNASKKQLIQAISQRMHLDLRGEKNIKTIAEKAETVLKREKQLWFSFAAQQEHSVLEYLQDLSIAIDRASVGLELRQLHIDSEKVTMTGSVKSFEALDVFEEELLSLQRLQLLEKPRELTFTLQFKAKDSTKGQKA